MHYKSAWVSLDRAARAVVAARIHGLKHKRKNKQSRARKGCTYACDGLDGHFDPVNLV